MLRQSYLSGGRGHILTHTGVNPAVGLNWGQNLSSSTISRLLWIGFHLACNVNVIDRVLSVFCNNGTFSYFTNISSKVATASDAFFYSFALGQPYLDATAEANMVQNSLAEQFLVLPGSHIDIAVANIQAGDQLSNIYFVTEEYFE